ncbi:hypothetical protein GCM10017620_01600 [Brevundimonas intermedia]|uniref:DUF3553 domain-containing protein n=1 Tax=Brevundimonas intermedia TaxID=74315 RepID=A0ABQ5T4U9_9CAUL|nr:hypothetical protein GCM10017620_01600 [Brevundimonas intermedia]
MRDGKFRIFNEYYEDVRVGLVIQFGADGTRGIKYEIEFSGDDLHNAMRRGHAVH